MSEAFNRASIQAAHDNRKRVYMPTFLNGRDPLRLYPNDRPGENGLTPLEYAAIHLRVEHPDLPGWLNEMIRRARRDEFAKAALADTSLVRTSQAWAMADAMIKESGK